MPTKKKNQNQHNPLANVDRNKPRIVFNPTAMRWQRTDKDNNVEVFGELWTSENRTPKTRGFRSVVSAFFPEPDSKKKPISSYWQVAKILGTDVLEFEEEGVNVEGTITKIDEVLEVIKGQLMEYDEVDKKLLEKRLSLVRINRGQKKARALWEGFDLSSVAKKKKKK
jgi:hypothetical protein